MRLKELRPMFDRLLIDMPGFIVHKSLLLKVPMNGISQAIHFDSSAFDKYSFYPATVVMPLCVPMEHLSLLFGYRLRHPTRGQGWTIKIPDVEIDLAKAIREQGLPFLASANSLLDMVELAEEFRGNPHTPKKIAFALARAGETEKAIAEINALLPELDLRSHWQQTIADQSIELRDVLIADPEAARAKLSAWENYTIEKLGLQAFR